MADANLTDFKGILESRTIIGALVAIAAAGVGTVLHVTVSPADQSQIVSLILNGAELIGSALAIYGRIVATKQIGAKV